MAGPDVSRLPWRRGAGQWRASLAEGVELEYRHGTALARLRAGSWPRAFATLSVVPAAACGTTAALELRRESAVHRWAKRLRVSAETATGEPDFDAAVYAYTDDPARIAALAADAGLRSALRTLLAAAHAVHVDTRGVELEFVGGPDRVAAALARDDATLERLVAPALEVHERWRCAGIDARRPAITRLAPGRAVAALGLAFGTAFAWLPLALVPGVQLDATPLAMVLGAVGAAMLVVVAGLAALVRGRVDAHRILALAGGTTAVAWLTFGVFGVGGLNRLLDRTPLGVPEQLPVIAKHVDDGGRRVELDTGTRRVHWSAPIPIHDAIEPGRDCARVHVHPGALGAPARRVAARPGSRG